jgi:dihydrofolate reductase
MRKLKLQVQMSVDGFIAGKNGEMDWMTWNWDDKLQAYVEALTEPVDCILLGRKLAQGFIPYWAANQKEKGADKINNAKKVVFTKTLDHSEWDNTILAKGDLVEEITKLKNQEGKDIIVYGGGQFVSSLLKNKMIDDLYLFINPVALGEGMAIFADINNIQDFKLIGSRSFDCGITIVNYVPK